MKNKLENITMLVLAKANNYFDDQALVTLESNGLDTDTVESLTKEVGSLDKAVIAKEFDDNSSEFSPLALSLTSAVTLNEKNALSAGPWADIKILPKDATAISFEFPYYSVESIRNGKVVGTTNLADLDRESVDRTSISTLVPTYHSENDTLFNTFSIRPGSESTQTASLAVGKKLSLFDASDLQTDITGDSFGRIDIISPSGSLKGFLLKVTDADGNVDHFYVKANKTISMNNNFVAPNNGVRGGEVINANFVYGFGKATQALVNGASIDSGTTIAPISTTKLDDDVEYTFSVDINAELNRKTGSYMAKSANIEILTKTVIGSDVHEQVPSDDEITNLTIDIVGIDLDIRLTNTSHRNIGNILVSDFKKYYCVPSQKDVLSVMIPTEEDDRLTTDSVFKSIEIQSYKNKTDMSRAVIDMLPEIANKIKLAKATGMKPNIPNEMTFRPTYIEEDYNVSNLVVMRSSEETDVNTKTLQLAIENLANRMAIESAWHNISFLNCKSYQIEVLVNTSVILSDFVTSEGISVKVTKSVFCKSTEVHVTFRGIGGPVINGVEILRLATVVVTPTPAYIANKFSGTGTFKAITTEPVYDIMNTLPILGKLNIIS